MPSELFYSEVHGGMGEKTSPDRGPFTGSGTDWKEYRKKRVYANSLRRKSFEDGATKTFFRTPEGDATWSQGHMNDFMAWDKYTPGIEADAKKS